MSTARELADFLTRVTPADLPPQALDHAAMLVPSTIASAAMGSGLESARIVAVTTYFREYFGGKAVHPQGGASQHRHGWGLLENPVIPSTCRKRE